MKELKPPTSKEMFQLLNGLIKLLGKEAVLEELIRRVERKAGPDLNTALFASVLWTMGRKKQAERVMALCGHRSYAICVQHHLLKRGKG